MKTKIKSSSKPFAVNDSGSKKRKMKKVSDKKEKKQTAPLADVNNNSIDEMAEAFANYGYFFVTPGKDVTKE